MATSSPPVSGVSGALPTSKRRPSDPATPSSGQPDLPTTTSDGQVLGCDSRWMADGAGNGGGS
uniref:Uncharacterized protein n=1 Tax=Oryza punctata TaxID=4537 RepID=A0A0E0LAY6_ORYPU